MAEKLIFEKYTLILRHDFYENGKHSLMEEPIAVSFMTEVGHAPTAYIINDMLKRLQHELLSRLSGGGEK